MDLHGKVALVTGGAIRVGKAISLGLAAAGANVVMNYHSSAVAAQETADELKALGVAVLPYRADVSRASEIAAMVEAAVDRFGRLDVLVNSASIFVRVPWSILDEATWDRSLAVNLKGPFLCSQACAPHLAAHGDGAIVNIVDGSALRPFPNYMAHSASKAGLLNMTYALAGELAPAVRVNAIVPGPILPPVDATPEQNLAGQNRTLLRRWGSPADIAGAVVYLVQADYVTGIVLPVDGGEQWGFRRLPPAQGGPAS
jgi:NAD(P)-dependent dehydrogenase (short-subunit alcohol dehydrogenase family)